MYLQTCIPQNAWVRKAQIRKAQKNRLNPQILNPRSATFAEGPQI
jgi:hypothetical protein